MDDVQGFLKKNWMYVVGALVGLYLVYRFMAGGSGGGDAYSGYASFVNAQNQAGLQQAQIAAQSAAQQASIAAAADKANKEYELGKLQVQASAQTAFLQSQAQMAQAVGQAASGVIGALYQPTIAAMQSAAYENAAALQAGAQVAGAGFVSQASMVQSTSNVTQSVAQGLNSWGSVGQGAGYILSGPTTGQQLIGAGTALGMQGMRSGLFGGRGGSVSNSGVSSGRGSSGEFFSGATSALGSIFSGGGMSGFFG